MAFAFRKKAARLGHPRLASLNSYCELRSQDVFVGFKQMTTLPLMPRKIPVRGMIATGVMSALAAFAITFTWQHLAIWIAGILWVVASFLWLRTAATWRRWRFSMLVGGEFYQICGPHLPDGKFQGRFAELKVVGHDAAFYEVSPSRNYVFGLRKNLPLPPSLKRALEQQVAQAGKHKD